MMSMTMESDEEEMNYELSDDGVCVGSSCDGASPHPEYALPHVYHILPHQTLKWNVGASIGSDAEPQLKITRNFVLPQFLGLGDNGRWRWESLPLFSSLGLKIKPKTRRDLFLKLQLLPHLHLESLRPVFGKLALHSSVEVSDVFKAKLQRDFVFGKGKLVAGASVEDVSASMHTLPWASYSHMEKNSGRPEHFKMKLTQSFGMMVSREEPLPTSVYVEALKNIGRFKTISIVPGHWIDPGIEQGAPGERAFNLEVANVIERKLRSKRWQVQRPDRDAPNLPWEEYLNWVSRQTCKGRPVLEIHGQGSKADYRGHIYGVIGNENSSLSKELANEFGIFEMDWTGLGVPRRGGIIVESFNTDEVLQMDPLQRISYAKNIATRISRCIEKASSRYRSGGDNVARIIS